jgi:hypothetical protein
MPSAGDDDAEHLSPVPDFRRQPTSVPRRIGPHRLLEIAADDFRVLGTDDPSEERVREPRRIRLVGWHGYPLAVLSRVARPLAI